MGKKMGGARLSQAMPKVSKDTATAEPMNDWETKNHLETLVNAHEIVNNPEKMAKVHKLAGRHKKVMSSLQDVKDYNQAKYGSKPKSVFTSMAKNAQDDEE